VADKLLLLTKRRDTEMQKRRIKNYGPTVENIEP